MKTIFDLNEILFSVLSTSSVKNAINGGIYIERRPDNSTDEDIVVNSIDLTQDHLPQVGTSNVNIYVRDTPKKIKGKQQLQINKHRLEALSERAMEALRGVNISGLKMILGTQTVEPVPNVKQHYVNIRINWNIQTD